MNKIVSEDAVRRAFAAIDEDEGAVWLRRHLDYCTAPLLAEPWILDIDTTVKPLYGHQEGAVVGLLRTLKPDFKTIADFRSDNRAAFRSVFRQFRAAVPASRSVRPRVAGGGRLPNQDQRLTHRFVINPASWARSRSLAWIALPQQAAARACGASLLPQRTRRGSGPFPNAAPRVSARYGCHKFVPCPSCSPASYPPMPPDAQKEQIR